MTNVRSVLDARSLLGEGPFWDVAEQRLYWVDIKGRLIHRFDPATGRDESWPTPEDVGSLATREQGGLVIALKSGFYFYDLATATATPAALPKGEPAHNRFNDGKTDRQGRFWAGSMDDEEKRNTGGLYRLKPDLSCDRMVDGIICSNSLCWSPDSRAMYYADSWQSTVWAWDFEPASGEISNRCVFATTTGKGVGADGATVDAEGFVWLALWGAWRVVRYDPKGRIDRTVEMPVRNPTCPAFGGPDLDIMYVTSATNRLSPDQLAQQPLAGNLFAVDVGVKGLPEMRFKG
jgi:sugar lactone lactonase YvrE